MTCRQIDEFLDHQVSGADPSLPQWVAEHCRDCERCRKLLELLRGKLPDQELPRSLQSQIESAVLGSLKPVSPLPSTRGLMLGFLATFTLLSLVGVMMMGGGALRVMSIWQFASVGLILGTGAVLLAISLSWLMVPGSYQRIRLKALIFCVAAAFLFALALLFPWRTEGMFVTTGLRCATAGFVLIAPASVCFWLLVRRGAILSPGLAGATTGLLAGLTGAMVLHFGCVIAKAPHLIVWHAGVPISSALAGFVLGKVAAHRSPTQGRGTPLP